MFCVVLNSYRGDWSHFRARTHDEITQHFFHARAIMLVGLVEKDAILFACRIKQMQKEQGTSAQDALLEAG